jgi:hypothetical protein
MKHCAKMYFWLFLSWASLVACAPDPCVQRCPNDPRPTPTETANCRAVQNNINTATGPCAEEIRQANLCLIVNTYCDSNGRSSTATAPCNDKTSAALECCVRNIGRAPACAFWR